MKLFNWLRRIKGGIPAGSVSRPVEHAENLPDWGRFLDKECRIWSNAKENAQNGPDVLIATTVGGFAALVCKSAPTSGSPCELLPLAEKYF